MWMRRAEAERKTLALPAILSPVAVSGAAPAQADADEPAPVCGDAGGAPGDQRHQGPHRGHGLAGAGAARREAGGSWPMPARKLRALRRMLEEPNAVDSFRTLIEQVDRGCADGRLRRHRDGADRRRRSAGDAVAGGRGLDPHQRPLGRRRRTRRVTRRPCRGSWNRAPSSCCDNQLMYVRMNPRSFTPFGLGPLEVAFETVNQFLSAHRFAGKLAANSGGAVRAVAERGHARAARPADPLVAGRDRGHGPRAAASRPSRSRRCCALRRARTRTCAWPGRSF